MEVEFREICKIYFIRCSVFSDVMGKEKKEVNKCFWDFSSGVG